MKYKYNGVELNFSGGDSLSVLVKEVILEAINILNDGRYDDCKKFLKENFNVED